MTDTADPSQPYPSRKSPGHVRVYVEVTPE